MLRLTLNSHVEKRARPSNVSSVRNTFTQTSCTTSSATVPSAKNLTACAHTAGVCSRTSDSNASRSPPWAASSSALYRHAMVAAYVLKPMTHGHGEWFAQQSSATHRLQSRP